MYLISSAGRVGTTMFIDWLSRYRKTNNRSDRDRMKHLIRPVNYREVERAVYLFTRQPEQQAVSLVKRFGNKQVKKLSRKNLHLKNPYSLKFYPYDVFSIEKVFKNWWFADGLNYDVAFVCYDSLWQHLGDIVSFLKLTPPVLETFPPRRPRQGTIEILESDPELERHLQQIYSPFREFLKKNVPDFYVKHGVLKEGAIF